MTELARFKTFCTKILNLRLEQFQFEIVEEVLSGRRETLVLLPRGNGKSTLLAAIALWHLLSTRDAQIAVGAASREQAAVLFDIARGMASHPAIASRVEITRREIRTPTGFLKIVSSDGPKQHGLILTLAIVDELHAHATDELYIALRTGLLKRRDAKMVVITTAGADLEDSALAELRRRALEQPKVERDGALTRATGPNLALLEWSLPEAASIDDMEAVKTANPASWLSESDLAEQREAVHEMAFRRYHCNQWVAASESAISPTEWAACGVAGCEISDGAEGVYVGVDLGLKWDSTALVPVAEIDGKIRVHKPIILVPPRDGTSLELDEVIAAATALRGRWPECTFVADPEAGGEILCQRLDAELGGRILTHSQKASAMCKASELLSETIAAENLEHPDDQALNRHVLGAAARFYGPSWRFVKQKKAAKPIDAVIALAMATRVLVAEAAAPKRTRELAPAATGGFA